MAKSSIVIPILHNSSFVSFAAKHLRLVEGMRGSTRRCMRSLSISSTGLVQPCRNLQAFAKARTGKDYQS